MNGIYTPLQLTVIASLLQNQGFVLPGAVPAAVTRYNNLPLISTLLSTISDSSSYGLSAATVTALKELGSSLCPGLAASVPAAYADTYSPVWTQPIIPATVTGGFANLLQNTAERYLGNGDLYKFCSYFSVQQGYREQNAKLIYSAVNSTTWLGPTYTSMNSLITAGITDVTQALPALSDDLSDLGYTIDLSNIDNLGTPGALLQQISKQAAIVQGTIPCIQTALIAAGFSEQEINDLATPTQDTRTRLSANEYNVLQKRAYPALTEVKGECLATVFKILEIVSPTINSKNTGLTLADLLDPKVLFPRSYKTLTLKSGNGISTVYNDDGSLNSQTVQAMTVTEVSQNTTVNCDQLAKIIPPDQAVANQAIATSLTQITGIRDFSLPEFARIVASIQTLKGLDQIQLLNKPIPDVITQYYQNEIAKGTGPFGTYLVSDFLGTLVGQPAAQSLNQASATVDLINTATLKSIYDRMLATVQGTYGPASGPVNIPAGPAGGTYASGDEAFVNGLIPAAEAEIQSLLTLYPAETTLLNTYFNDICQRIVYEADNQDVAGISFDEAYNAQSAITSFVNALPSYSEDKEIGGAYQFLLEVSNFFDLGGQATIAAMREAQNSTALSELGVVNVSKVPSTYPENPAPVEIIDVPSLPPISLPPAPYYQLPENPGSISYDPIQLDITPLPSVIDPPIIVSILGTYNSVSNSKIYTLEPAKVVQGQNFYIKVRILPTVTTTEATLTSSLNAKALPISVPYYADTQEGFDVAVPGWMVDSTGPVTITVTATNTQTGSSAAGSFTVVPLTDLDVITTIDRKIVVSKISWYRVPNIVLPGDTCFFNIYGIAGDTVQYTSPWGPGTGTIDSTGVLTLTVNTPVVGEYQITVIYNGTQTVTQSFTVTSEVPPTLLIPL